MAWASKFIKPQFYSMIMVSSLEELKKEINRIDNTEIKFSKHFYDKTYADRGYLNEAFIISCLKDNSKILGFQKQIIGNEERYRIGIKLSSKYNLAVVVKFEEKGLYIITAWKTNRKWQKAIQK